MSGEPPLNGEPGVSEGTPERLQDTVGRTPWSARVPPDPLPVESACPAPSAPPPTEIPPEPPRHALPATDFPTAPPPPPPTEIPLEPPPSSPATELQPAPPPERDPFWGYSDLVLFIGLAIPCMLAGGVLALLMVRAVVAVFHMQARIPAMEPLAEQLGGDVLLFAALAMILRLQYDRPFWRSLAWLPARIPFLWAVICGLVCALSVALLGTLLHTPTTTNPMTELMQDHTSAILMAIFGVTIAPLTEELVFRGFLQPLLVRSLGAVPGILMAAIPFGLLHYKEYGNSWRHAVLIALAGTAFGWMRHRTGSTQASTIMHASYNALIFLVVFK
ncbi:MAG: CPBP family intramembrane metalloprotease [Acidobacteriia bacterium]|nr:CPBP family intramembrane metalloprotease [Terriglobia bacterium]